MKLEIYIMENTNFKCFRIILAFQTFKKCLYKIFLTQINQYQTSGYKISHN